MRNEKGECPILQEESKCYQFEGFGEIYHTSKNEDLKSFESASEYCKGLGGHLVDAYENRELIQKLSTISQLKGSWIGLKKVSGEWIWQHSGIHYLLHVN